MGVSSCVVLEVFLSILKDTDRIPFSVKRTFFKGVVPKLEEFESLELFFFKIGRGEVVGLTSLVLSESVSRESLERGVWSLFSSNVCGSFEHVFSGLLPKEKVARKVTTLLACC